MVGSIYKGKIRNLEDGLKAAFVDIGYDKNAFLHYWDIIPSPLDSSYDVVDRGSNKKSKPKITNKDILVISPFNAQVNLLKQILGDTAKVGTIDNFQGQEAPIVIISYVSSNPETIPRGSDFFFDFRRLNVSLSRAKCLAIIMLNQDLLEFHCNTIEDMERLNFFCKLRAFEKKIELSS